MDKSAGLAVIHIRTFLLPPRAKSSTAQPCDRTAAPPNNRLAAQQHLRLLRPEVSERLSGEAEGVPFVHGEGTEGAVEVDGGLIPLQDAPLDT